MKFVIGSDHVGVWLKSEIISYLESLGHVVVDLGPASDERTDYPVYGKKVAEYVVDNEGVLGILICGTGVGISLSANKVKGIRAVVCSEPYTAKLSREHNNSNILAFGARVIGLDLAKMIVKEWIDAEFEGGRHQNRIEMISKIEEAQEGGN